MNWKGNDQIMNTGTNTPYRYKYTLHVQIHPTDTHKVDTLSLNDTLIHLKSLLTHRSIMYKYTYKSMYIYTLYKIYDYMCTYRRNHTPKY